MRYTARLADVHAVVSVGSRGDSYDKALAESETQYGSLLRFQLRFRPSCSNWNHSLG